MLFSSTSSLNPDLSSGDIIWDFAGNIWEWTDWQVALNQKAYASGFDNSADRGVIDFFTLTERIGSGDAMSRETWQPFFSSLGGDNGLGRYYARSDYGGQVARRGGRWNSGREAGVYSLNFWPDPGYAGDGYLGFRCVYRP